VGKGIHVQRVAKRRRNEVPQDCLLLLVVPSGKFEPYAPEYAEAFENSSNVGIYREGGTVERAHHHARSALRADFRQAAKEVGDFNVGP
jgi:hypothetical protein